MLELKKHRRAFDGPHIAWRSGLQLASCRDSAAYSGCCRSAMADKVASHAAIEGVAGAMGGILALLSTYPLLTITTLQATRGKRAKAQEVNTSGGLTVPLLKQGGTLSDIAEVINKHGWLGLYRGLQPALLGTALSQGVYFYLYSSFRQMAVARHQQRTGKLTDDIGVPASLLVAMLAGCGNVLLTNPIWTVTTNMQAQQKRQGNGAPTQHHREGPIEVARGILREDGILGLWRGCLPSLIMVTNPTTQYVLYEWLLARLAEWRARIAKRVPGTKAREPGAGEFFIVSALAKLGATVLTYPLLVVKSRLQAASKDTHADLRYSGTADAVRRIWQTEGPFGFYNGMKAKIVQSVLAAALLMASKEELTRAAQALLTRAPIVAKIPVKTPIDAPPAESQ